MANQVMLKAKGLYTFQNFLSAIPEGALLDATNVNIDRDGIIEPRRGIHDYGAFGVLASRSKQLLNYKNRILAHYGDTIAYDDGTGTFTDFSGTFTDVVSGLRIKAIELNGNFYVTTSNGIKKISASSSDLSTATISDAGGVKALDVTATVNYDTAGFFTGLSKVAYRVVWGIVDVNDNLILGAPSSRTVVTNFAITSGTVDLQFVIPEEITSEDYFYQVYRTTVVTAGSLVDLDEVDPGDEMKLVFESNLTSAELLAGEVTVNDITPEDFQQGGTPLYTNPVSGEGILQANDKPPVAQDIAIFKNSAFYANTRTIHRLSLSMLGVGALTSGSITNITDTNPATITSNNHGLSNGDRIVIVGTGSATVDAEHVISNVTTNTFDIPVNGTGASDTAGSWFSSYITVSQGMTTNRYFFVGRPEVSTITFDTQANTTDGSWFEISSAEDLVRYAIWFDKTGTTPEPMVTGKVLIKVDISAVPSGTNVAPTVLSAVENATNDFAITESPAGTLIFITANNGAATNAAAGTTPPGGAFAIVVSQQGFGEDLTKNYVRLSGYISAAQAVDDTSRSLIKVINNNDDEVIEGFYLSGPDDVPGLMNFESRTLDDSTFTFTSNNSDVGALFNPDLTDGAESSDEEAANRIYFSKYQQPEAVPIVNYIDIGPKDKAILRIVPLRDSLFIFKEDGIYRLTGEVSPNFTVILFDNSVELIAPDTAAVLNNQIYALTDGGISTISETGVGIISRPIENVFNRITTDNYPNFSTASFGIGYETDRAYYIWTVTDQADTLATQCFRFNTFTQSWTRWDKSQTCAVRNFLDNKLYFGSPNTNVVEVERKTLTRRDYADRDFELQIPNNAANGNTLIISSVTNADIGDAIIQTQYLTANQFNMLLLKLDSDPRIGMTPGTFDTDYYATLAMIPGDNLTNKMISLVNKLNADPGTDHGYVFSGATDFQDIQEEYNVMINQMNTDNKLKFTNYKTSTGTLDIEMTVTDVNINSNTVTATSIPLFMVGPITLYNGIQTSIIWAPLSMGDPSMMKHIRESTMLFETSDFIGATVGYGTDLSPSFEDISFTMDGNGTWGGFFWGENTWGGSGTSVPFRTYIPRQKQRCRYIRCRFVHSDAFYKFSILGISYVFEMNSERAYRGNTHG